jgi:hypothetical protein
VGRAGRFPFPAGAAEVSTRDTPPRVILPAARRPEADRRRSARRFRQASTGSVVAALLALALAPALLLAAATAPPRVVINEIMYHPPDDRDDLQFIELHNPGTNGVDLSGWSLTKGVEFVFPHQTEVPAGGWVVVCRDIAAFKARYGAQLSVAGVFTGTLSHKGERVELTDAQRRPVDAVEYGDRAPWPLGADGYGGSLERICPATPGDDPANWAASEVKATDGIGGTPGRRNSCFSAVPLLQISDVRFAKAEPQIPLAVTATVADAAGIQSVTLAWGIWENESAKATTEVPMTLQSGDAHRGVYVGSIPAQPEGRLVRFTIRARSASGAERLCPSKTEPRPTFSCATFLNTNTARVPFLQILTLGSVERPIASRRVQAVAMQWGEALPKARQSWGSAAVYLPPGGKDVLLFDHVHVRPRKGGLKIHFHKDQPLHGMTGINVIFENSPRWLLSEPLAYELYRRTSVPAPATEHVRLTVNQRPLGYHLLVEQPNQAFLRRQGRNANSDVFKLLWYGGGLVGQHEKKTHPQTGHQDLLQVIGGLNRATGAAQWDFIQQHFNVDELMDYYAVNMCIENWDGFFNNYLTYHDLRPGGKWGIIPWDQDKTWGDYDGASPQYDWYDMPLTYGMNGDKPPRFSLFGAWPVPGAEWWRSPGHFSGPLLANPEFRRRFLSRLREICETIFTPEAMAPVIQALETRLEEEVAYRAQLARQNPEAALRQFRADMQSFRNQVVHRREFILKELDARQASAR